MIGILLALQVNTWNEARKQNIIHGHGDDATFGRVPRVGTGGG